MLHDSDFRAFFDSNLAIRFVLEASGKVVAVNSAAVDFYGLAEKDFLGRDFDSFDFESPHGAGGLIARAQNAPGGVFRCELRHCVSENSIRDVSVYVEKIETENQTRYFVVLHDITGLMGTRRQLMEVRERYELASRGANDGIWDWNIETDTRFWSDRCKALLGYEPHEVSDETETVFDYVHVDDAERIREAQRLHFYEEHPYDLEYRLRCKDGTYRWFHVRGQALWNANGEPLRMAGSIRDVTDRIASEQRLRSSEERFVFAVAGTQQGIWDWNTVTEEYYWSPQFKALLGYQDDELSARQEFLYEIMHPGDVVRVRNAAARHLAGEAPYDIRYRLKVRNGLYRWFWARGQAAYDDEGKATRVSGSLTDVHEEVQVEADEKVRRDRVARQHKAVLELATDDHLCDNGFRAACARIVEKTCEVLDIGRCSVMMFEKERTILRTKDLFVVAKDQHFCDTVSKVGDFAEYFALLQSSRVLDVEDPYNDPRTREFPNDFLNTRYVKSMLDVPVRLAGATIGSLRITEVRAQRQWREDEINFAVDVSQQVARAYSVATAEKVARHQQELEKRMLQAQKLESLGVMAGGIAHDFNNLLVVIMGNADLVGSMLSAETKERKLVSEIESASHRAAELCHQMLAFSGHTTFEVKRFDLSALVEEMTQLLRASIPPNAATAYTCVTDLPEIEGDPTQVRQVIMNLIVNASEAVVAEGGGHVQVRTGQCHVTPGMGKHGLDVPEAGDFVYLEVKDDGIGMSEEVLERIYDPFFSTKFTGRGLGLATMLGIMRSCRGGISVESEQGKGSCFRAFFPTAPRNLSSENLTASAIAAKESLPKHSGKALLVDDDQTVLLLGTEMLSRLGFEVLPASDGEEAISLFKQHHQALSLVVLDLTMPHMDGEETLRHLQAIDGSIPVVMSSGYTEQDVARRIGENDFAAFMQKPYTLSQLEGVLATVLSKSQGFS